MSDARARRSLAAVAILLVLAAPAHAASSRTLATFVRESGLGRGVSVSVLRLDGTPVYEVRGRTGRVPASNEKLVTAVAALDELGAGARLQTAVLARSTPIDGVLRGSLYLVGGGDPTLGAADLRRLALQVRQAGIRRVTGPVVGDESLWDARRDAPGWKPGFLGEECPPLSALAVERNRGRGTPATRAAAAFVRALRTAGVRVSGAVRRGTAPVAALQVAGDRSRQVRTLLRAAGKHSDNFTAEMLLKAVAADAYGRGTTAGGARRTRFLLRRRGLDLAGVRIADGSGLSLRNRMSTGFLARLLVAAASDPSVGGPLRASLAVAGRDGTLRNRMTTGPARGVVRAKTGTLAEVSALSGYAGPYAFSVIVNGGRVNQAAAHALQDRIAQYLAREA